MLGDITGNFAAAGRMADMDRILQVQMLGDGKCVGRIMVHVVTFRDLGRTAMATAVMGDDAIALGEEEQHLRVPVVRRQRPAMMENDRLGVLRAPVLVEDFDAVLGGYISHGLVSFCGVLGGCSIGCKGERGWNCESCSNGSSGEQSAAASEGEDRVGHLELRGCPCGFESQGMRV
ncbi:hypothetical protein D3C80_1018950 [compost metagenome]